MKPVEKIYAVWVYVKDLGVSKKFYEDVFGVEPRLRDGGWIEFDMGDTVFAILQKPEEEGEVQPTKTRIMFQVSDMSESESKLQELGVKIIQKKVESYGTLLTFEDPNGNWLELYGPKKTGSNIVQ